MSLTLNKISKSFKDDVVLDDLSLEVPTGKTLVLFGPSGAGKTVLLRLIAGVIEPDVGDIIIGGCNMEGVEPEDRGIGMAFQNFALFPHLSALDNIASPLAARRQDKSNIQSGVEKLARLLKIDHVLGHKPKELSNGQKQRTALARALAGEPRILLLDDPLRNVDAKLRFEMRLELPRLIKHQHATVIYVTQDYKEAMAFGDEIAVVNRGRIQQVGTPEDVYLSPANMDIAQLFGDPVINLLEVTPQMGPNGLHALVSDQPLALPTSDASIAGRSCVLGLRPEALHFVDAGAPGAIPVTVETETPLNEKTITLAMTARGREVMLSRPAGTPGPTTGPAHIAINHQVTLLFDAESQALIPSNDLGTAGKVA
ncbi:MAG: ABC transporter ATP-binding protein [Pseudomonadota bacterium]